MHSRRQQWIGRLQILSFCLGCEQVSVTLRARARQRLYLNIADVRSCIDLVKWRGCWLADSSLSSTRVNQKGVEFLGEPTPRNSTPFWVHLHISSGSALGHADSRQVWHWLVDQVNRNKESLSSRKNEGSLPISQLYRTTHSTKFRWTCSHSVGIGKFTIWAPPAKKCL